MDPTAKGASNGKPQPQDDNQYYRYQLARPLTENHERDVTEAVEAGAYREDYLRHEVAEVDRQRPQLRHQMRSNVLNDQGHIEEREDRRGLQHQHEHYMNDYIGGDAAKGSVPYDTRAYAIATKCPARGQVAREKLDENEAIMAEARQRREREEGRLRDERINLREAIRDGKAPAPNTLARDPVERGRPTHTVSEQSIVSRRITIYLMIAIEGSQLSFTFWDTLGVDTSRLLVSLFRSPLSFFSGLTLGLLFAYVSMACLYKNFQVLDKVLRTGEEGYKLRVFRGLAATALGVGAVLGLVYIGEARHDATQFAAELGALMDGGSAPVSEALRKALIWFPVLTAIVGALTHLNIDARKMERRTVIAAQRAWDRENSQLREELDRREYVVGMVMEDVAEVDDLLDKVERENQKILEEAAAAHESIITTYEEERKVCEAFENAALADLARAEYEFNRQAHSHERPHLIQPGKRQVPKNGEEK